MEKGERKLVRQVEVGLGRLSEMLGSASLSFPRPAPAVAVGPSVGQREGTVPEYVMVSVNLDGREIAQAVTKPSTRIQNRTQRRNTAVRGKRI